MWSQKILPQLWTLIMQSGLLRVLSILEAEQFLRPFL